MPHIDTKSILIMFHMRDAQGIRLCIMFDKQCETHNVFEEIAQHSVPHPVSA